MPELQLYNSLSREKQVFTPINPDHVRLYACGPTVYNYAHIGNARMAVVFDLLTRVLKQVYPKVTYVSNITDVDDKIMAASRETGEPIDVITRKYEKIYNEDMAALGCAPPDIQPRATEHIGEMIAQIEALIAHGHAYAADGHVLFNVPSFPEYGGLSGRSRDEQIAGARVEVASYKKDPADFVLWKPSAEDEPGWDSPWGYGRPGWHIECSAMAEKHLGLPFDIHGGGADLKFPHHENEIAQSCCAHGTHELDAFAKVWVHNGFLTVEGEKMSKSLGNFLLAHDLVQEHPGEALRLTLLSAHYRQPLDWSADKVAQSKKQLDKFYDPLLRSPRFVKTVLKEEDIRPYPAILDALLDDLNTPLAISKLHELSKESWRTDLTDQEVYDIKAQLIGSGRLLGILQKTKKEDWFVRRVLQTSDEHRINSIIDERAEAKAAKNFARADEIRDQLAAEGIEILDTPEGTKWRKA